MSNLSKVETHLLAFEVALVEAEPGISRRQRIAEVDPDATETLKELEGHVRMEGAEQRLKTGLGREGGGGRGGREGGGEERTLVSLIKEVL